ncbi:MAG: universal stress protein [Gemmatimonadetes bacterium]|nr:universal stress protein [Gemmatimonadota bacterium]
MLRSILVPLDGSCFGEHALPWAGALARRSGAKVELVHVHKPVEVTQLESLTPYQFEGIAIGEYDAKAMAHEQDYLAGVATRLEARGLSVTTDVLAGRTAATIEGLARERDTDLIVMSSHGRTGVSRAWLGSVADGLVRHTSTPTLLVRSGDDPPDWETEPHVEHMLIPLDGSETSEAILEPAALVASLMASEVTLLHVVPTPAGYGRGQHPTLTEYVKRQRTWASDYLDLVARRLAGETLRVQTRVLDANVPVKAILDTATEGPTDLIAMATHGYGGFTRAVLGSVTDKILRGVTKPMLLRRPLHE